MDTPPRDTLHLQDSEVLAVQADLHTGEVLITLAAAYVSREPGRQTGYLRGVSLRLSGAQWQGDLAGCMGRIAHGHVRIAAGARQTRMALPVELSGTLELDLIVGAGGQLHLTAQSLHISAGDGRYTEALAC